MRLAIADPPYPPNLLAAGHGSQLRASRWYGAGNTRTAGGGDRPADVHPDAAEWDDPARHRRLLLELGRGLRRVGDRYRTGRRGRGAPAAAGRDPDHGLAPTERAADRSPHRVELGSGAAVCADARRSARGVGQLSDVLRCAPPARRFAGAKPAAWVHWVLAALGYDQDQDTVTDVLPGSGAVSRAVGQLTLGAW